MMAAQQLDFDNAELVGRADEINILQNAFNEAAQKGESKVVFVKGPSGSGKSSLIEQTMRQNANKVGGIFASGKCDQICTQRPFASLVDALDGLCALLTDTTRASIRVSLLKKSSEHEIQMLAVMIPSLRNILVDKQINEESIIPSWNGGQQRLQSMLRNLLKCIAINHPVVVLFLDDLHWAERKFIDLLVEVFVKEELSRVLFIGSYRNDHQHHHEQHQYDDHDHNHKKNKKRENHKKKKNADDDADDDVDDDDDDDDDDDGSLHGELLEQSLVESRDDGIVVEIGSLSMDDVGKLLGIVLRLDLDKVRSLAKIVHRKTLGNPFFVIQFLDMLQRKEYLNFSFHTYRWEWNVQRIESETEVSDNVVDLVTSRILSLPSLMQNILKIASCLGNRFDGKMLGWILECWDKSEPAEAHIHSQENTGTAATLEILESACCDNFLLDKVIPTNHHYHHQQQQQQKHNQQQNGHQNEHDHGMLSMTGERRNSMKIITKRLSSRRSHASGYSNNNHEVVHSFSFSSPKYQQVYKFTHDRIQQSAYGLIPEGDTKRRFHFRIGMLLWRFHSCGIMGSIEKDLTLLLAADQFKKCGVDFIKSQNKVHEVALLNYEAAKKVRLTSAFFASAEFLRMTIDLLGAHRWVGEYYDLTLNVSSLRCEMEFCCGNIDKCMTIAHEVIRKTVDPSDKFMAQDILVSCYLSKRLYDSALKLSNQMLRELSVRVPCKTWTGRRIVDMVSLYRSCQQRSDEDLITHPVCASTTIMLSMKILCKQAILFWLSGRQEDAGYVGARILAMSFRYGYTEVTPLGFGLIGGAISKMGKEKDGYRLGSLALKIADRFESRTFDACTLTIYYLLHHHLYHPYTSCLDGLLHGHQAGMSVGVIDWSHTCLLVYVSLHLCAGLPLGSLAEDIERLENEMVLYNQRQVLALSQLHHQLILILMGQVKEPFMIGYDEEKADISDRSSMTFVEELAVSARLMLFAFFGADLGRSRQAARNQLVSAGNKPFPVGPSLLFPLYRGVIWVSLARGGKRRYKRLAKKELRRLQKYVKKGFMNAHHAFLILQAEVMSLNSKNSAETIKKAYDDAVSTSSRVGCSHHTALANEKAGVYFRSIGDKEWSSYYFENACSKYEDWGAQGKVDDIQSRYSLSDSFVITSTGPSWNSLYGRPRHLSLARRMHMETDLMKTI